VHGASASSACHARVVRDDEDGGWAERNRREQFVVSLRTDCAQIVELWPDEIREPSTA